MVEWWLGNLEDGFFDIKIYLFALLEEQHWCICYE